MLPEEERTIAFVDLSGFTALTEAHGDETATAVALRFYEIVRSLLRDGTTLVKTIGDAVMLVAVDPETAISLILELQALTDSTPDFPMIRAGLHVGPAREVEGDYFGASVNLAARVAAHASAGQVLCTAAVATRIAECGLCTVVELGPVLFRNVHDRVVIYEVRGKHVTTPAHIDPVCRMHVTTDAAIARIRSESGEIFFCSLRCLRTFVHERLSDDNTPGTHTERTS